MNKYVTPEQQQEIEETAHALDLVRSLRRRNFDYQERWHGWGSPVGLGLGFALVCLGAFLITAAFALGR